MQPGNKNFTGAGSRQRRNPNREPPEICEREAESNSASVFLVPFRSLMVANQSTDALANTRCIIFGNVLKETKGLAQMGSAKNLSQLSFGGHHQANAGT
jgi:hypothetical protein